MGRMDGIHFGTGEEPQDGILDIIPADSACVLNEPEGKHWWQHMKDRMPDGLVVYRAAPELKPAQVGWDADAYSQIIFQGIDFHHERYGTYPSEVLLLNELNLDYERGDSKNDGGAYDTNPANWPDLYGRLSQFLSELLEYCKDRATERGFDPRWWFPGWAPGHGEMSPEIASIWVPVARQYDAVCLHAYHDVQTITDTIIWYDQTFPDHALLLGEWDMQGYGGDWRSASKAKRKAILKQRVEEETRVRSRLRSMAAQRANLWACYFIHFWAEDSSHEHDIRGHDERMALWDGRISIGDDGWVWPGKEGVDDGNGQGSTGEPTTPGEPVVTDDPIPDPWRYWSAEQLASATLCPLVAVEANWPKLNEQLWRCGMTDKATLIAVAARVPIETAHRFEPIHEFKNADGSIPSWWYTYDGGPMYHGRGFLQNTHRYNYADLGPKIAALWNADPNDPTFDLVANPDNLLDRDVSAAGCAIFIRDRRSLSGDSIPAAAARGDWRAVNAMIQGGSDGLADMTRYATLLGGAVQPPVETQMVYSVDVPDEVILQKNQWSCAARSTYGALWAMAQIGEAEAVTYGDGGPRDVYEWLVPDTVIPNIGLELHTGQTLAEELRVRGYNAFWQYPVSIEQVRDKAGRFATMIGGDAWNHWVDVRGKMSDGGLILENPSPGFMGITDYLRDSFDGLGPFAMVWIEPKQAEPEPAPEPGEEGRTDAEKISGMTSAIGYLTGDIVNQIEAVRAGVDDGVPRPSGANNADAAALAQFWANWDRAYADLGRILDEMRRVGEEQLG